MGIKVAHESDTEDDERTQRRHKRVRISETDASGSAIFSPSSDRASLVLPTSTADNSRHTRDIPPYPPIIHSNLPYSTRTTTSLRRRNAIRRRYLQNYPYRSAMDPFRSTREIHLQQRSYMSEINRRSMQETGIDSSALFADADTTHDYRNYSRRASVYNAWESSDDVLSHFGNTSSMRLFDNIQSHAYSPFESGDDEDRAGLILPVVPPPPPASHQVDLHDPPSREVLLEDDTILNSDGIEQTIGYTNADLNSVSSFSSNDEADKINLANFEYVMSEEAHRLYPRNEKTLEQKAKSLSKEKYGKVMASGFIKKRRSSFQ